MVDLRTKCSESEQEFNTRMQSRAEEIAAVSDTIHILNADESFDVFDKSVNSFFLQVSASTRAKSERKSRAALALQRAVRLGGNTLSAVQAARLASAVQLNVFDKVTEEIDRLVAELGKQQQDEVSIMYTSKTIK